MVEETAYSTTRDHISKRAHHSAAWLGDTHVWIWTDRYLGSARPGHLDRKEHFLGRTLGRLTLGWQVPDSDAKTARPSRPRDSRLRSCQRRRRDSSLRGKDESFPQNPGPLRSRNNRRRYHWGRWGWGCWRLLRSRRLPSHGPHLRLRCLPGRRLQFPPPNRFLLHRAPFSGHGLSSSRA